MYCTFDSVDAQGGSSVMPVTIMNIRRVVCDLDSRDSLLFSIPHTFPEFVGN